MTDFVAALTDPTLDVAPAVAFPGSDARAIAVLPFVNASADPENEYFSDGITDELITALTKVEGLQVASRTSVFALKGAREDVRALGARLNVSAIIEGSVRRAGQRLRITAQLTGVRDGRTLWSERYDRELADVFAIQDEIARTIVDTLRATLLQDLGDPTPVRYTANLKAYQLYLKGRYSWNRRTPAAIAEGIRYFEAATAEDAGYALAYTGLADSYALQLDYRGAPVREGFERARAEAQHALALDETLAEAHTSLAWVTFIYDWDWPLAGQHFRRAIELNPRYSVARQWHSWFQVAMGHDGAGARRGPAGHRARPRVGLDPAEPGLAVLLRPPARPGVRAAAPRRGDEPHRRGEPPAPRPRLPARGAVGRGGRGVSRGARDLGESGARRGRTRRGGGGAGAARGGPRHPGRAGGAAARRVRVAGGAGDGVHRPRRGRPRLRVARAAPTRSGAGGWCISTSSRCSTACAADPRFRRLVERMRLA